MRARQSSTLSYEIVIAGGGIAGLTLALLLARAGIETCVVDPAAVQSDSKPPKPSGRTVALMNSSLEILKAAGVWTPLEQHAAPLQAMRILDASIPGRGLQESLFQAGELGADQYGYNIPNDLLRFHLLALAGQQKNLTLLAPAMIADFKIDDHGAAVSLKDGRALNARLIVGADGRDSLTRKLAGIEAGRTEYDQAALTFLIAHPGHHNFIATEFHRPAGPLALVPMPGGHQSSVVWVERRAEATSLLSLKKHELEKHLTKLTQSLLGSVTIDTEVQSWPLCTVCARQITGPRVALIAEAAHVMSPITAQGLNLSLRDVAALAETLADSLRLGLDCGSKAVLDIYERRRMPDIKSRVIGVDGFNRLVSQDFELVKGIRRGFMRVLTSSAPLKRLAMQQGLAPTIDQGRLARGEGL